MNTDPKLVLNEINKAAVYISSIEINHLKSFRGKNVISLLDSNNKPSQWTVILGNNNTGKTTLLRAIANLEITQFGSKEVPSWAPKKIRDLNDQTSKIGQSGFLYSVYCYLLTNNELRLNKILSNQIGFNNRPKSWGYGEVWVNSVGQYEAKGLIDFKINAYGTSRRIGGITIQENGDEDDAATLFSDKVELLNVEEWLLRLEFAGRNGNRIAIDRLVKIKEVLTSEIFPDVQDFRFITDENLSSFVEVQTDYGWIKISDLGYGYQASIAWLADFMKRMFDRYPNSENPLREPAILLIDELDLHLHPEWQRKIIGYLTNIFPNTQFIVTSHSPLIVQSAENINLVILKKEGDHVTISQPDIPTFKGWTVEEILTELMDMGEKTQSDSYLQLMNEFDSALDDHNYEKAKRAYNELDKILHPESTQRKLLRIQMSSLEPPHLYDKTA